MPISIDEFRFPKFVVYRQKNPFTEDVRAKFDDANLNTPIRRYRQDSFPQQGYNTNSNKANIVNINLNRDDITLPPY
ncbi:hypothetical protein JZU46_00210 [bacterium]|nr:hypothetical protein [bacterium]